MKRLSHVILCVLVLKMISGCATLELLAATGASYLITGKSITDNAVSLAMDKDCALHRVIGDGELCREHIETNSASLLAKNTATNKDATLQISNDEDASYSVLINKQTVVGEPQIGPDVAQIYAVVGSFYNERFAYERQQLYQDFDAKVITLDKPRGMVYRVVAGPFLTRQFSDELPNYVGIETNAPWAIELCPLAMSAPPCQDNLVAALTP